MKNIKPTLLIIFIVIALLTTFDTVQAFPPLPSSFYGTVDYNGENLPEGTVVQALIDDEVVAETQTIMYQGESVYAIDVPGDDTSTTTVEGGTEGSEIHFVVGGLEIKETATWMGGTNVEFNLSITSELTPKPAEPTKTPVPTQTPIYISTNTTQQTTEDPSASATLQPSSGSEDSNVTESESTEADLTPVAEIAADFTNQENQTFSSEENSPSASIKESPSNAEDEQENHLNRFWLILIISIGVGIVLLIIFLFSKKTKNKHENLLF